MTGACLTSCRTPYTMPKTNRMREGGDLWQALVERREEAGEGRSDEETRTHLRVEDWQVLH